MFAGLVAEFHRAGPTPAWLEQMALHILGAPLSDLALAWFGHYLSKIETGVEQCSDIWPPVLSSLQVVREESIRLSRAARVISLQPP